MKNIMVFATFDLLLQNIGPLEYFITPVTAQEEYAQQSETIFDSLALSFEVKKKKDGSILENIIILDSREIFKVISEKCVLRTSKSALSLLAKMCKKKYQLNECDIGKNILQN